MFVSGKSSETVIDVPEGRVIRYNVLSKIKIKPTAEDDVAEYTCEARHEALPQDMPLRSTVSLSVLCKFFIFIFLRPSYLTRITTTQLLFFSVLFLMNSVVLFLREYFILSSLQLDCIGGISRPSFSDFIALFIKAFSPKIFLPLTPPPLPRQTVSFVVNY